MNDTDKLKLSVYCLMDGGDVRAISMYDEEGVEGWLWEYEDAEYCEIGDWLEPPELPDVLADLLAERCTWITEPKTDDNPNYYPNGGNKQ